MKKLLTALIVCLVLAVSPAYSGTIATSTETVADVITRVQADVNSASSTFWTDAHYIQWTNEAITEIVNRTRCLEETVFTVALTSGTYAYAIGTAYVSIEAVIYDTEDTAAKQRYYGLDRKRIMEVGRNKETGHPKSYYIWGDKIEVWPVPGADDATKKLYLYAVSFPDGVTATNSAIETPAPLDPAITNYVKAKALFKDNKESKGRYFMGLFNESVSAYVVNILRRNELDVK